MAMNEKEWVAAFPRMTEGELIDMRRIFLRWCLDEDGGSKLAREIDKELKRRAHTTGDGSNG